MVRLQSSLHPLWKRKRAFTDLALQDANVLEKLSLTHSSHMTDHEALYTARICSRKNSQWSAHRFWVCLAKIQKLPARFNRFNSHLKQPLDTCQNLIHLAIKNANFSCRFELVTHVSHHVRNLFNQRTQQVCHTAPDLRQSTCPPFLSYQPTCRT